jgi:hypothetical protein
MDESGAGEASVSQSKLEERGEGKPPPWLCSSSLLYTLSLITTSSRNSLYYFYMVQIGEKNISPVFI